ncbi:sporulation protein [Saccharomonospora iraqiensis]|uniref:sporulation protein n=1 Tax=Saccharomonospora iraqiensis TaxID=52698 RepID=UPI0003F746DC|nr:sporulation protein [Saccharomonospora iraqiensis]
MVFRKLLGALGIGGPSVDTVLHDPHVRPGGTLSGEVRISGGSQGTTVEHVVLGLVTGVETGDDEVGVEFHRVVVGGGFGLAEGAEKTLPFEMPVPWETPVSSVHGQPLPGMTLGLRTELSVEQVADKGDLDPVGVEPLPVQQRVLDALSELGFQFTGADLEHGHLQGINQQLPFFQELEFVPPPQASGLVSEVEVTFVTGPDRIDVVLEADRRGGMFTPERDAFGHFSGTHDEAASTDWAAHIAQWLDHLAEHRGVADGPGLKYTHDHDDHGDGGKSGMGGMLAGAAVGAGAGILGGMALNEMLDDDEQPIGDVDVDVEEPDVPEEPEEEEPEEEGDDEE